MCFSVILKVKCKTCLAEDFGDIESIDVEHCPLPCSRPYTVQQIPADDVPERHFCEICRPELDAPTFEHEDQTYSTIRFNYLRRDAAHADERWDARHHTTSKPYCKWQTGISMNPIDPVEEATTVQEQLNQMFKDFGNSYAVGGKPLRAFLIEPAEDSWELVNSQTQWQRDATCEEVEEDWMLLEAGIMSHA